MRLMDVVCAQAVSSTDGQGSEEAGEPLQLLGTLGIALLRDQQSLKVKLARKLLPEVVRAISAVLARRDPPRKALGPSPPEEALLRMDDAAAMAGRPKVFVVAATGEEIAKDNRIFLLRTYAVPQGARPGTNACAIWEAGRATGAAPTFFDPMRIEGVEQPLIDGGVKANNPAMQGLEEAELLWPDRKVGCLISLGCGAMPEEAKSKFWVKRLVSSAVDRLSETEEAHGDVLRKFGLAERADLEGKVHRVDPYFGSTLAVSNTGSQPN